MLTERNIRDLVKLLDEEMDGVAHEQRERLETIESELAEVHRRLDRLYNLVETTNLDMADVPPIRDHRERRAFIESFVKEIVVSPGNAVVHYTIPMPEDSPIPGRDAEEMAMHAPVLSPVMYGGPDCTQTTDLGLIRTAL